MQAVTGKGRGFPRSRRSDDIMTGYAAVGTNFPHQLIPRSESSYNHNGLRLRPIAGSNGQLDRKIILTFHLPNLSELESIQEISLRLFAGQVDQRDLFGDTSDPTVIEVTPYSATMFA